MRDYPRGRLCRKEFTLFCSRFFPSGDPSQFSEYLFNVFDADHNDEISFKEFIVPLSLTSRGTPDKKLECAYPSFPPRLPIGAQSSSNAAVATTPGAASLILTHLYSLLTFQGSLCCSISTVMGQSPKSRCSRLSSPSTGWSVRWLSLQRTRTLPKRSDLTNSVPTLRCADKMTWVAMGYLASRQDLSEYGQG